MFSKYPQTFNSFEQGRLCPSPQAPDEGLTAKGLKEDSFPIKRRAGVQSVPNLAQTLSFTICTDTVSITLFRPTETLLGFAGLTLLTDL